MGGKQSPGFDGEILCSRWCDAAETSGIAGGTGGISKI